jgi:hypothetical protein
MTLDPFCEMNVVGRFYSLTSGAIEPGFDFFVNTKKPAPGRPYLGLNMGQCSGIKRLSMNYERLIRSVFIIHR